MSVQIPVNPAVLRWARLSMGKSLEDVAVEIGRDKAEIEAWELGEASPTYAQLEKLAYKVYKRPVAVFFFPTPPKEDSIEQSFRTLPEHEVQRIPPRVRFLLRKAKVLQLNLAELYEQSNPVQRNILRDLDVAPSVSADSLAELVREYLGIDLAEQESWSGSDEALKRWRDALEEHGIFVFKDSFSTPGRRPKVKEDRMFSGFCLYDTEFPVIYVNNNKTKTRQIFTLFHELAHLLMQTGGVDTQIEEYEEYIEFLSGNDKRIEILCNRFAAAFLMPTQDFEARVAGMAIDDELVLRLAGQYSVSREAILRRFLDRGEVTQRYYEEKRAEWLGEVRRGGSRGGNYYLTKGAYLGERYIELVFGRYHQKRISIDEVAEYLGEKAKNVPGMEALLYGQGTPA